MCQRIVITAMFFCLLGFVFSVHAVPLAAKQGKNEESRSLKGTWVVKSMEQIGMKLEGDALPVRMRHMKRIFDKQHMTVQRLDREYKCTFTVDNNKTPKQMDVILKSEGRTPRTLKCIYEIKADTLRLAESQGERAMSFETDRTMRRIIVYTFRRQKEGQ